MLLTLLSLFFLSAVAVIFLNDWYPIVQRIYERPLIKLFVPLGLMSYAVARTQDLILWGLSQLWVGYVALIEFLVLHTPSFFMRVTLYQAVIITLMSLIPTFFWYWVAKPFRPFRPPYWSSVFLYIGCGVLIALLEGSL